MCTNIIIDILFMYGCLISIPKSLCFVSLKEKVNKKKSNEIRFNPAPRQPAGDNGGYGMHHRSPDAYLLMISSCSLASAHFFEMTSHLLRKCDPNPRWIWAGVVCLTSTNFIPPPIPCLRWRRVARGSRTPTPSQNRT